MGEKDSIYIGVIGAGRCSKKLKDQAFAVGMAIAEENAVLVCGGLKGIMEAAAKGARQAGGTTIGIIPGNDRTDANPYCDIVIPTGMGEARNVLVVQTSDTIVALHGKYGTISEMSFALKFNKPLVSLVEWSVFPEVIHIPDPVKAVKEAVKLARNNR
jgi:uncharacterized protein (TIGR00725 family)